MKKRLTALACVLAMILTVFAVSPAQNAFAETELPYSFGFTEAETALLESSGGSVVAGENAVGEFVYGVIDQDGDGAAYMVRHIDGTAYSSLPNGVELTLPAALPAETNYILSAWFYVPSEGNTEGKSDLIGPGLLINGNAGDDSYKWPNSEATAGLVKYDEWMQVVFSTSQLSEEIDFLVLRFYTNSESTHPDVWYLDNVTIILDAAGEVVDNTIEDHLPGLKDVYKDYFMLGTAGIPTDLSGKRMALNLKHFDTFTFGNEMKPLYMQGEEGVFTFTTVDKMIGILKENGFNLIGHTLLWHSQSPEWMWSDKDLAKARLEAHIEAVLSHAGPDLVAVDVVNEAFSNNGGNGSWTAQMREEGWYSALGHEFIELAFRKAGEVREAIGRPDLKLYYNDFNEEFPSKAQNIFDMVSNFRKTGVPIDGIGMQGHYNSNTNIDDVRRAIELFNQIEGIEVSVTELDITIESSKGNPSLTEAEALYQAGMYAELFKIYKEYAAGPANPNESKRLITRVTLWGSTDLQSWRSDRNPLLFDRNNKAKPAFYAVLDPDNYLSLLGGEEETPPAAEPSASPAGNTPDGGNEVTPPPADAGEPSGFPWVIVIVCAAVAAGGAVCWVLVKSKKKS